jgi:hypothetical protein
MLVVEHGAGLAQQREGLRGELEPDHMRPRLGSRRILGPVTRAMVRDELLDLPQGLVRRCGQPRSLGRRGRDPRQLAHRRERQVASRERRRQPWQVAEGPCYPQPVLGRARRMAQHALEVVEHRDHAERAPDLQPLRLAQPAHLLGIERGAAPPDRSQRAVHRTPVEPGTSRRTGRPRGRLRDVDRCLFDSTIQHDGLSR